MKNEIGTKSMLSFQFSRTILTYIVDSHCMLLELKFTLLYFVQRMAKLNGMSLLKKVVE